MYGYVCMYVNIYLDIYYVIDYNTIWDLLIKFQQFGEQETVGLTSASLKRVTRSILVLMTNLMALYRIPSNIVRVVLDELQRNYKYILCLQFLSFYNSLTYTHTLAHIHTYAMRSTYLILI